MKTQKSCKSPRTWYQIDVIKRIIYTLVFIPIIFSACDDQVKPAPQFTVPCEVFAGESFQITNSTTNASNSSWTFGDGGTSTATSPTYTYNTPGAYTITLIANDDDNDDQQSTTKSITVVPTPPLNKLLPVTYTPQYTQVWCWAASTQMALSNFNINVNQCEMVNYYIFGSTSGYVYDPYTNQSCNCCDAPTGYDIYNNYLGYNCEIEGMPYQISSLLRMFGNLSSQYITRPLTWNEIILDISQNRPILMEYEGSFSGHVVVLCGYDQNGNLYIDDPDSQSNPLNPSQPQYWIAPYASTFTYGGSLTWANTTYKIGGPNCE